MNKANKQGLIIIKLIQSMIITLLFSFQAYASEDGTTAKRIDVTGKAYRASNQLRFLNHREIIFYPEGQVAILTWYDMSGNSAGNPLLSRGGWQYKDGNMILIQEEYPGGSYGERFVYKNSTYNVTNKSLTLAHVSVTNNSGKIYDESPQKPGDVYALSKPEGPTRFKTRYPSDDSYDIDYISSQDMKKYPYKFQ